MTMTIVFKKIKHGRVEQQPQSIVIVSSSLEIYKIQSINQIECSAVRPIRFDPTTMAVLKKSTTAEIVS